MDRDVQLMWLQEFDALTPEGRIILQRMLSRFEQTKRFPYEPGAPPKPGAQKYTVDQLLDCELDLDDEPVNADWEHQNDTITVECVYRAKEMLMSNGSIGNLNWTHPINLDCLQPSAGGHSHIISTPAPIPCTGNYPWNKVTQVQTKEENMYTQNQDQVARDHLITRANRIERAVKTELHEKFNMSSAYPKNAKQAKDWLARGGMSIHTYGDTEECGYDTMWSNPDKPRNEEGYKAAEKLLGKAYVDVKDAIIVKSPEDGLKALQAFEATSFVN